MSQDMEDVVLADNAPTTSNVMDDSPRPIKRAARTYGRRRDTQLEEESALPDSFFEAPQTVHTTKEFALESKESLPPNSPLHDSHLGVDADSPSMDASQGLQEYRKERSPEIQTSGVEEDEVDENAPPKFEFSWRKNLRDMDQSDDDDKSPSNSARRHMGSVFGTAKLLQSTSENDPKSPSSSELPRRAASEDVFTAGPAESPSRGASAQSSYSSPLVLTSKIRKRRQRVVELDSEEEDLPQISSSTPGSASRAKIFSSPPKPGSPSTDPTSDDDLPARISLKSNKSVPTKRNSGRPSVAPLHFTDVPSSASSDVNKSKQDKKRGAKGLSKKEQQEMVKDRGRLAVNQTVSIARGTQSTKFTVKNFFAKVSAIPPSDLDPIDSFSSPNSRRSPSAERAVAKSPVDFSAAHGSPPPKPKVVPAIPELADSSDDDMPEVGDIHEEARRKRLVEFKRRKTEEQALTIPMDDEDDLVITRDPKAEVKEEDDKRRSGRGSGLSAGRKAFHQLAHVHAKKPMVVSPRKRTAHTSSPGPLATSKKDLNDLLLAKARVEALKEKRKKEEMWTKHGGRLAERHDGPTGGLDAVLGEYAERGAKIAAARATGQIEDFEDDDEDEDDGEYNPGIRGSLSPEPEGDENDENMQVDDHGAEEADRTMVDDDVDRMDEDDEDADITQVENVRVGKRNLVLSDDEDENVENTKLLKDAARQMSSSSSLGTEDEYDKENNTNLMYDRSEDKENAKVPRHTALSQRPTRDIFDLPDSPESRPVGREEMFSPSGSRRPLGDLISDESPRAKQFSSTGLTQTFTDKLQASPMPRTLTPSPTLKPLLARGTPSKGFGSFTQFSQAEGVFSAAPLQPGFSDIFENATEKQKSPSRLGKRGSDSESPSDESNGSKVGKTSLLRRSDTLDLTQDVAAAVQLQDPFQPENVLDKADIVFEKEQVLMVEANLRKPRRDYSELYVNDMGFLTQTMPVDGTPVVYTRPSPTRSSTSTILSPMDTRASLSSQTPRLPLRTLSYSGHTPSQPGSPDQSRPLQRLKRRTSDTPSRSTGHHSPATTPPSRQPRRVPNIFDEMARAQKRQERKEERKRLRAGHGNLVQDEAAESDEDDMFGFIGKNPAEKDEDDGEDMDQELTELMDHSEMTDETLAAGKVHEKYNEQAMEEDQKLEEHAKQVVQGEHRRKRKKNGVSIDDSDEESEEEGNDRLRRKIRKMNKSDRGAIKDLANNEATRQFAKVYNDQLQPEGVLTYLATESQLEDIVGGTETENAGEDDDEPVDEEEEETVDVREVAQEISKMKRQGVLPGSIADPHDVDWVDDDGDNDMRAPRVKRIDTRQRPPPRAADSMDASGLDGPAFRQSMVPANEGSKRWYAQESKSRNGGTARSVGGSAITGHAQARKPGGTRGVGTMRKGTGGPAGAGGVVAKPVRTASSALSVLGDRSGKFA